MIQLEQKNLEIVLDILNQHLKETRVFVFGSRATHQAEPYSDLDLGLLASAALPRLHILDLKEKLSASDLPISVDVVDLHRTDSVFRADVLDHGIEIVLKL
jgi:predicted nucleotidyltransferase